MKPFFLPAPLPKDGDGNIILHITVRDDSDFLSPFSSGDDPVISEDVAAYIESRADVAKPDDPLAIHIHSDCITPEEETVYRKAVALYYAEQCQKNQRTLRRNTVLALILLAFGIITLSAVILVSALFPDSIWIEVVDIVAWVFLWEAADLHFLENRAHRLHQKRLFALSRAPLTFDSNKG